MHTQTETHHHHHHHRRPRITPGAPPGHLHPVSGSASAVATLLTIIEGLPTEPRPLENFSALPVQEDGRCHWVRVTGLGVLEPLRTICNFYGIPDMVLEDILDVGWRSKLERSGEFLFIALQTPPEDHPEARSEHIFLLYKPGIIITFENTPTSLIDTLWQRLASSPLLATIHSVGAYLAYSTLDLIIDHFFPLLYKQDEILTELENIIAVRIPTREELTRLHAVKRELISLRHILTPYCELEPSFRQLHIDQTAAAAELAPYLNDLRDHITQAAALVEAYNAIAVSLHDMCQSDMTNRMNDIIKTLTIISTIFMPLTFIAGVYGMNFDYMPELRSPFGYPSVLCVMLAVVVGMIWFFHKKKLF
jgi:magnesium transporter